MLLREPVHDRDRVLGVLARVGERVGAGRVLLDLGARGAQAVDERVGVRPRLLLDGDARRAAPARLRRGAHDRPRLGGVVADQAGERDAARGLPALGLAGAERVGEARVAGAGHDLQDPGRVEQRDGRAAGVRAGRADHRDHLRVGDRVAQRDGRLARPVAPAGGALVDREEVDRERPRRTARLVERELLGVDHVAPGALARLGQQRVHVQRGAGDPAAAVDLLARGAAARQRGGGQQHGRARDRALHGLRVAPVMPSAPEGISDRAPSSTRRAASRAKRTT